uniref:Uncharacterized protein n=1 Tax=Anopheles maculatus TaxID=74869 RepID=A0A182T1J3_9DIPT
MLAMRRESEPIYGSVSATSNLNLLHHHAHHHHHSHHHQQLHSPSGHSHPSNGAGTAGPEPSPSTRPSANGTLGESSTVGVGSDHTVEQGGVYQGHSHLAPQQQSQDHLPALHHHHHHSHRTSLSPVTSVSFGHAGFASLCNGSSTGGLYPGFNSFALNAANGSSLPTGRSTHPAASSLDEYVDILQVQQLLLENSSSAAASASSSTVASITTASSTSTTATTTTTTSSSSASIPTSVPSSSSSLSHHLPPTTASTASFFSPTSAPSTSSSAAFNAKNRPKVNLQKAAEFSAASANQLQGSLAVAII